METIILVPGYVFDYTLPLGMGPKWMCPIRRRSRVLMQEDKLSAPRVGALEECSSAGIGFGHFSSRSAEVGSILSWAIMVGPCCKRLTFIFQLGWELVNCIACLARSRRASSRLTQRCSALGRGTDWKSLLNWTVDILFCCLVWVFWLG